MNKLQKIADLLAMVAQSARLPGEVGEIAHAATGLSANAASIKSTTAGERVMDKVVNTTSGVSSAVDTANEGMTRIKPLATLAGKFAPRAAAGIGMVAEKISPPVWAASTAYQAGKVLKHPGAEVNAFIAATNNQPWWRRAIEGISNPPAAIAAPMKIIKEMGHATDEHNRTAPMRYQDGTTVEGFDAANRHAREVEIEQMKTNGTYPFGKKAAFPQELFMGEDKAPTMVEQKTHRSEFGGVPLHQGQKNWNFALVQDGQDKILRLRNGSRAMSLRFDDDMTREDFGSGKPISMTRLGDVTDKEFLSGDSVFSKGVFQIHKSSPGSIHATMQDGKNGLTMMFEEGKGGKWTMVPKPKNKLSQVAGKFVRQVSEGKTAELVAHIAGPSGSGKTTLLNKIKDRFPNYATADIDEFDENAERSLGYNRISKDDYSDEMLSNLHNEKQRLLNEFLDKNSGQKVILAGHHTEAGHVLDVPSQYKFMLSTSPSVSAMRAFNREKGMHPGNERRLSEIPGDIQQGVEVKKRAT
jgi:cytidylate kinase